MPRPRHISVLLLALAAAAAEAQTGPPYKAGFPLVLNESPANQVSPVGSHVLAADLGLTPGFKSIVFGLRNGDLYVAQRNGPTSWGVASGWPQTLPAHIYSSPAVGDLNNDSQPDIVVGFGSTFVQDSAHGGVRAYRRNGTLLWEVQTGDNTPGPPNGFRDPVMGTPALGDVNGDGQVDVVFGALDHYLYVINGATGNSICPPLGAGEPAKACKNMGDTVFSSAALHDLDGDGRLEIAIGADAFYLPGGGGRLWVLRWNGATLADVAGFPKDLDQVVSSSPVVGDIDGDGQPEIVHGTGHFFAGRSEALYAWNCDGSAVAGWGNDGVPTDGEILSSPALANLDGDAPLEVLATTSNLGASDGNSRLYAFNGNGSQVFAPVVVRDFFGLSLNAGEPIVADVLGADSAPEILVTTNGEVAVFTASGARLTEIDNFPDDPPLNFMTQDSLTAVAVTNLETGGADNQIEVIAVSGQPFPDQTQTVVHVWNPVSRATPPLWGFFRHDERRRGVAPGTPACSAPLGPCPPPQTNLRFFTLPPCRAVDTRNAAGPLGGPALVSLASRSFDLTGVCGIPASARAVSLNVTVTQPTGQGHVVFSPGCAPSGTSVINFGPGQTRANNTLQPLSAADELTATPFVLGNGFVHLIIDVNGFFE